MLHWLWNGYIYICVSEELIFKFIPLEFILKLTIIVAALYLAELLTLIQFLWVYTVWAVLLAFWKCMLPPFSGLKCVVCICRFMLWKNHGKGVGAGALFWPIGTEERESWKKLPFQGPWSAPNNWRHLVFPSSHPSKCSPDITLLNLCSGSSGMESAGVSLLVEGWFWQGREGRRLKNVF
jgi:hypothetical protein